MRSNGRPVAAVAGAGGLRLKWVIRAGAQGRHVADERTFFHGETMEHHQHPRPPFWKTPFGLSAALVAIAASAYLYLTHKDYVLAALPFLLLAACPLLHVFMHGGHRGHSHGDGTRQPSAAKDSARGD